MQEITVEVADRAKAHMLLELLKALDFVDLVRTSEKPDARVDTIDADEESDFFSLAGLWADREVNLESIRQQAWPRQQR